MENIAGILDKSVNKKKISCESIRGKVNTVVESYFFLEQNQRPKLSFALKSSDFNQTWASALNQNQLTK